VYITVTGGKIYGCLLPISWSK